MTSKCSHIGHSYGELCRVPHLAGIMLVMLISQPHLGQGRRVIACLVWMVGWVSGIRREFPLQETLRPCSAGLRGGYTPSAMLNTEPGGRGESVQYWSKSAIADEKPGHSPLNQPTPDERSVSTRVMLNRLTNSGRSICTSVGKWLPRAFMRFSREIPHGYTRRRNELPILATPHQDALGSCCQALTD